MTSIEALQAVSEAIASQVEHKLANLVQFQCGAEGSSEPQPKPSTRCDCGHMKMSHTYGGNECWKCDCPLYQRAAGERANKGQDAPQKGAR